MQLKDLPVDEQRRLTGEDKRALSKQLGLVLESNQSLGSAKRAHERQQLIAAYRKEVGVDKLLAKKARLEADAKRAQDQIQALGFTGYSGAFDEGTEIRDEQARAARNRLGSALNAIQDQNVNLYSAKIISRLWLCSTVGEALVVMNEVVGNGILPTPKMLSA